VIHEVDLDTVEEEPPSGSTANPYLFYLFIYLFIHNSVLLVIHEWPINS